MSDVHLTDGFDLIGPFESVQTAREYRSELSLPLRFEPIELTEEYIAEPGFGIQFEAFTPESYPEELARRQAFDLAITAGPGYESAEFSLDL